MTPASLKIWAEMNYGQIGRNAVHVVILMVNGNRSSVNVRFGAAGRGGNSQNKSKKTKPGRKGKGGGKGSMRKNAQSVLAPGAGATVGRPFGGHPSASLHVWDAKMPHHLPLPRAVGPYTVIKLTKRFSTNSKCVIIPTLMRSAAAESSVGPQWSNIAAIESNDASLAISAATNTLVQIFDTSSFGTACTLVPSALTVQIMNPNPLQTTQGVIYAGVMPAQAAIGGSALTWVSRFDSFVGFQNPRILTAPKLALNGVQINSYPLDMSDLSNFTTLAHEAAGATTLTTHHQPSGFAPIMVYNADDISTRPVLEFLVTAEFRVRFDFSNVQSATHIHYPVASDGTWSSLMARAVAMGNGVKDIAAVVSDVGGAARAAQSYMKYL